MIQGDLTNSWDHILEDLYDKYFECFSEHSEVTSSYWRTVGWQKIDRKDNKWLAKGGGFGSVHSTDSLANKLKFLPQKALLSYLLKKHHCPQYLIDSGNQIAVRSGRFFDFDCVKQVLSLHLIITLLGNESKLTRQGIRTLCVIGDGYGFFSSLAKLVDPDIRIVSINLGRTLFFDVLFSKKCFPEMNPILIPLTEEHNKYELLANNQLVFIEAENYCFLKGLPIDLFVNIASMQEMDVKVIEKYFRYMRSSLQSTCYFYCCNRLKKRLPDGTITEFMKYPWQDSNIILDELCPWYQKYPSSRPPFWVPLDGSVQHRFVKLK